MEETRTELIKEIMNFNEPGALKLLAKEECNINAIYKGYTVLMYACQWQLEKVALEIIKKEECDITVTDRTNETALIFASELGLNNVVLALLRRKEYNMNCIDKEKNSALMHACIYSLKDVALKLIKTKECDINAINNLGETALIKTCMCYNLADIAEAIIAREDCDINYKRIVDGFTALLISCQRKLHRIALALITREDCDINILDNDKVSALIYACDTPQIAIMEDVALALIKRKDCKLNSTDENGYTALMLACDWDSETIGLELIKRYYKKDNNLNIQDNTGKTALMYACSKDNEISDGGRLVALKLIENDCELQIRDNDGNSALIYACDWGIVTVINEIKRKLTNKYFNIEKEHKNNNNETALMRACIYNNKECIQILTDNKDHEIDWNFCLNSYYIHELFQVKFTKDTFIKLYNLGEEDCGAICLNTMGFSKNIIKELLKENQTGDIEWEGGIEWEVMKDSINEYIKEVKLNEPERLGGTEGTEEIELIGFEITNVYMMYGFFFNKLSKGYCTIIGFNREDESGHYVVIAKSDSGKTYIFDTQLKAMYRGIQNIINFLNSQQIVYIYLYTGDIKLSPPEEYSSTRGKTENTIFRPVKFPTLYNNNTISQLHNSAENENNSVNPHGKNTRKDKQMKQQKKLRLRGTITRGVTTAGLERKKKRKSKRKPKRKPKIRSKKK